MKLSSVLFFSFFISLHASACRTILSLETDDALYPGHGEVQLCTNNLNHITKLIVVKPVNNPYVKNPNSVQADERTPIMTIGLDQINTTKNDIVILTPSRMGIEVKAAMLQAPEKAISKDKGGEVVLKVLKSKILGSYHYFRLRLVNENQEWSAYLIQNGKPTQVDKAFFTSGMSGIKRVEFN